MHQSLTGEYLIPRTEDHRLRFSMVCSISSSEINKAIVLLKNLFVTKKKSFADYICCNSTKFVGFLTAASCQLHGFSLQFSFEKHFVK